jgi:epoxyqueuosine reductase
LARIARFARANWYAELAARLKDAASRTRARLADAGLEAPAAREWRFFVNSRLPEKRLALEAGIGRLGRHTLLMAEGPGSAVVLGILLLPLPLADPPPTPTAVGPALDPSCESCGAGGGAGGGACVEACPTGALRGDGTLDRELCLQHWSSVPGPLPAPVEAAWGDRLYGCDLCQEACPRFRPDPTVATSRGVLGPGLSASWLAGASDSEIRASLRGSALGMGWIPPEALRRNASLALRGI